jgi:eukaryotic-like serine/threonine-protein kinase
MALQPGTRLESYEVVAALGAGGMGEVYRARDCTLNRDVALKILPELFASDPDRLARFTREAQMLAALNHPNIAQIYGVVESPPIAGRAMTRALVMELVEGEDLAQRLLRGPIPVKEALTIARQVVDALDTAHERGIVHRDLKPANIKVAPDGTVKILDFGLAKKWEPAQDTTSGLSNTPTALDITVSGAILGTPAYMSPEQARGKSADRAADVWAFACLLYEMLTGIKAFRGETATDTLAAIVTAEPGWGALRKDVPPSVQRLLRRCLAKDRRLRLRDAGAVLLELTEAPGDRTTPPVTPALERWAWIGVTALLASAALGTLMFARRPAAAAPELRVEISTPPTEDELSLALSADGQKIVFAAAAAGGESQLWLRSLDSSAARPLSGTNGATYPFWSPDGRAVAFFADNKIKRIDVAGGPPQTLVSTSPGRGGAWNTSGVIVFAATDGPLRRVSEKGGESTPLTRVETPQQLNHRFPQFLPDGQHFLFYVRGAPEVQGIYVASLDGAPMRRLLDADPATPYYTARHLLFIRQGALLAQPFDVDRLELNGSPFPVAEPIAVDPVGLGAPLSVAAAGSLAFRPTVGGRRHQLIWFDRKGHEISTVGNPDTATPLHPELSSDGRRVAISRNVNGNVDIWLLETNRGLLNPLTFDAAVDDFPLWSPDGHQIVFTSNRKGAFDLYRKATNGEDGEELLLSAPSFKSATDWSRDGRFILFRMTSPETGYDLWALPIGGDNKPIPIARTNAEERDGQFSPDGKWIAYQSNESGRFEIYLQAFPGPGTKSRISTNGGAQVRWRQDSRELFYVALDGQLMAVPIRLDSNSQAVEAGAPTALFRTRGFGGAVRGVNRQQYVVSPDGQRFLINALSEESVVAPITLILNWRPGR